MAVPSANLAAWLVRIGDLTGRAARPTTLARELARAAAGVRALMNAAACSIALVEPDGAKLRFAAADGAGSTLITDVVLSLDRGIAGWVALSGQAIAVSDVQGDSRFAREVAEATDYIPETILAVPLIDDHGATLGVLEVLDPEPGSSDTAELLDLLATVGVQVASIVRLAQVFDSLGAALLQALTDAEDPESFGVVLRELSGAGDDSSSLAALAATFHELASLGPEAARLAQRVLDEVVAYARVRR
jgi:signal transduction protein with GAF and PtsI domain